jgi:hypothetical protein
MSAKPLRFIGEPITVEFETPPPIEKKPPCPNRFTWRDEVYDVTRLISEWSDWSRRGRSARNMRPTNMAKTASRGSWGVGRLYFRVRVASGAVFDIYYDREPKDASDRKGSWFLYRELVAE